MDRQTDLKKHKGKFPHDLSMARLNMGHMGTSWAAGVAETNVGKKKWLTCARCANALNEPRRRNFQRWIAII